MKNSNDTIENRTYHLPACSALPQPTALPRFSAPLHTGPGAHSASHTIGTDSFLGVKRPGRGVDHPPHLAPKFKKEQSYTSTPPLGLRGLFQDELYLYLYLCTLWQMNDFVWRIGGMIVTGENRSIRRASCPIATQSTKKFQVDYPGTEPGARQ